MISRAILICMFFLMTLVIGITVCVSPKPHSSTITPSSKTTPETTVKESGDTLPDIAGGEIVSATLLPDSIVAFARTQLGIPYLYASTDPAKGFDCSGFITYVFNHFNIKVPRSSVDFTHYGKEVSMDDARPGDLILFTGTDSTIRIVGHMGIVESMKDDKLYFIHSTSGKAKGVVITPFENYYRSRFVKVIRVFPDELFEGSVR